MVLCVVCETGFGNGFIRFSYFCFVRKTNQPKNKEIVDDQRRRQQGLTQGQQGL